ncbi:MAG: hypothetical protein HY912_05800 [Desulfomonile tiedjei]|uniref:Uncharacterized protein n=1 Tax=Desulfomonile tiedjei TaxID=2358 RepID=A0A9D6UYY9_9BACT|nr:hypothetical protein [Desulfomonile tiedjei]
MVLINDKHVYVRYLCSTPQGTVPFNSEGLRTFVPLTRSQAGSGASSGITYGDYLDAVKVFLDKHHEYFMEAVSSKMGPAGRHVSEIDIITEKHGSDYHPARVTVRSGDLSSSFVVNVALTERGRERLEVDFELLRKLNERSQPGFIPEAYFKDEQIVQAADGTNTTSSMFLGEWFDGFHEFHLTAESGHPSKLVLWHSHRGCLDLSENQARDLYRKAAYVLTWHYNPNTGEEIFPWHHASGDFVAKVENDSVDVRLITVRQYASRTLSEELSQLDRLNHLLFFLANLTIRMRLDRFDGIGDVAWADSRSVKPCVQGFLGALKQKVSQGSCDHVLMNLFTRAVQELSPGDLTEIFQIVVDSYNEDAPDVPVIMRDLPDHILQTYLALLEIPDPI